MPTKSAISSVTIWGILLTAVCAYCPHFAAALHLADPATQNAIAGVMGGFGTFAGLVLTLYGRLNATQAISGLFKAKSAPSTPPAAVNLVAAMLGLGLFGVLARAALVSLAVAGLTACATSGPTPSVTATAATLRMDEGKALTSAYTAGDVVARELDLAATSGALKGHAALTARKALLDLQVGLATAQSAYAAGDATAAGQVRSLASLLTAAAAATPLNARDSQTLQEAIALASALAPAA